MKAENQNQTGNVSGSRNERSKVPMKFLIMPDPFTNLKKAASDLGLSPNAYAALKLNEMFSNKKDN